MEVNIRDTAISVFGKWDRESVKETMGYSGAAFLGTGALGFAVGGLTAGFMGAAIGVVAPPAAVAFDHARKRYGAIATAPTLAVAGLALSGGTLEGLAIGTVAGGLMPATVKKLRQIGSWLYDRSI